MTDGSCESCLAHTTTPEERDEPTDLHQVQHVARLLVSPDERTGNP